MTDKNLQLNFKLINTRFFDGRVPADIKVQFVPSAELDGDDGEYTESEKTIRITEDFRRHENAALVVLIHEMAHAALPTYIGWNDKEDHGDRFEALRGELYLKGAYDGLL